MILVVGICLATICLGTLLMQKRNPKPQRIQFSNEWGTTEYTHDPTELGDRLIRFLVKEDMVRTAESLIQSDDTYTILPPALAEIIEDVLNPDFIDEPATASDRD